MIVRISNEPRRLSITELHHGDCRFPLGTVGEPDFAFCGLPALEGKPYCQCHSALAYMPRAGAKPRPYVAGRAA